MVVSRQSVEQITGSKPINELDRLRIALGIDGAVVYDWSLVDDTITWDAAAQRLLRVDDLSRITTGRQYLSFLDSEGVSLRTSVAKNGSPNFSVFNIEYLFRQSSGESCWIEDRGRRLTDDQGQPVRIVGLLRVVTERKSREARLNYLASYDELTGHLNRVRLRERLDQAIAHTQSAGRFGAYLVAAIDDLGVINSDYGFDVADEVIAGIGECLQGQLASNDEIGRTAGNKFGIIIADCSAEGMKGVAQRLVDTVHNSVIETTGGPVPVSISIGCVSVPQAATCSQDAMSRAEEALDQAKQSGRSSISEFSVSYEIESNRKRNAYVADQIVSALNDRRVRIAYQPIVSAETMEIEQFECLMRIVEPDGEILAAGSFIPIAEQLGLIRLLDRRVLELVVETLHEHPDVRLALNVSGMTATEALCVEGYLAHIEANRDVAERMTIELTETSAIRDMEESVRFLSRLRDLGCKVAIDDFGAGYTSFRNLQALVVDCVKIDGAFIRGLAESQDNQLFVRTLVDLAKNFGLETVAEWVGNAEEAELLRQYGVDFLQGFYIGEPAMSVEAARSDIPKKISRTA